MKKNKIPCSTGTCSEIYREKSFINAGLSPKCRLPVAAELGETSLALPVHPTLEDIHMEHIASSVNEIIYSLIE
jgi:dTDP-4-amino-4,6-dideoxygalactose transaminase